MTEFRCTFCNRYLFSYKVDGFVQIVVKCRGCGKTGLAKICVSPSNTVFSVVELGQ